MSASFEQLLEENLSTVIMKQGSLVTGIVIDILENHVVVHVGLKSEAAVLISEFNNETLVLLSTLLSAMSIYLFRRKFKRKNVH